MHGDYCAMTTSLPFKLPHESNRLRCATYSLVEDRWRYYNIIDPDRLKQWATAAGEQSRWALQTDGLTLGALVIAKYQRP